MNEKPALKTEAEAEDKPLFTSGKQKRTAAVRHGSMAED